MSADQHNEAVSRLIKEMVRSVGADRARLNVLAESLLVGVGMFNYPNDPRRQALIIQEISDGAQDRARRVGGEGGGMTPPTSEEVEAAKAQPFERYHSLASWIERLANTQTALSLGDWMIFIGALNHALTTAERGGEKHLADVARLQSALAEALTALKAVGSMDGEDHKRLCQGREYACSCGFDAERDALISQAQATFKRLSPGEAA